MAVQDLLLNPGVGMALLGSFLIFFLLLGIVLYIYMALTMMIMARRLKVPHAWLAWIPIANLYLMTAMAGVSWWWFLVIIGVVFVPFVGGIVAFALYIWWLWLIAERRKFPGWTSLLALIPFLGGIWVLILFGILAWKKK